MTGLRIAPSSYRPGETAQTSVESGVTKWPPAVSATEGLPTPDPESAVSTLTHRTQPAPILTSDLPDEWIPTIADGLRSVIALWPSGERATVIRRGQREPIPRHIRVGVYMRDGFRCVKCGTPDNLELDHITPWSAGGTDTTDNLRTLCHDCNRQRSNDSGAHLFPAIPVSEGCRYCRAHPVVTATRTYCMSCRRFCVADESWTI